MVQYTKIKNFYVHHLLQIWSKAPPYRKEVIGMILDSACESANLGTLLSLYMESFVIDINKEL